MQDPSLMPVPMHTHHPQAPCQVCRLLGRTGSEPLTRLPNSPIGQCPRALGDEGHGETSPLHSHAYTGTDAEQPQGRSTVALQFPLTTEGPAARLGSAMGQPWLCLLTLVVLSDLAAL